jgi:hypothetical protein
MKAAFPEGRPFSEQFDAMEPAGGSASLGVNIEKRTDKRTT